MSDLVERLSSTATGLDYLAVLIEAGSHVEPSAVAQCAENMRDAIARITELETAMAEAEGRVIADVVKWLRGQHIEIRAMRSPVRNLDDIATALETGEWKK